MKRTGFASQWQPKPKTERTLTPIRKVAEFVPTFVPTPKFEYVDDRDYRMAVASLPCFRCGIEGYTQACHSDAGSDGKGGSIKACDLTCWPGCAPRLGEPGCHYRVGHGGELNRGQKRAFELRAKADTQAKLIERATGGDRNLAVVLRRVGLIETP